MIILVNSKITDQRFYNFMRYNLQNNSRFDVARYCFASFAPLDPLVSKYVFHLDLDEFKSRQNEMESWIKSVLPAGSRKRSIAKQCISALIVLSSL